MDARTTGPTDSEAPRWKVPGVMDCELCSLQLPTMNTAKQNENTSASLIRRVKTGIFVIESNV